jgi:signal transduction histidine kinase
LCRHLVEEIKLSTGNKHAIAFGIQGQCTTVDMDENLLRYILSNLLSNAIKYSPAGSTVQFELFCQDAAVIFQIQDEGIGIPAEDVGQLFTSFHRAKNVGSIPGTGLGLAIVKQCVDLHGGVIAVASEVGVGTTFTVTLPFQNCRQDVTMALNQKFQ